MLYAISSYDFMNIKQFSRKTTIYIVTLFFIISVLIIMKFAAISIPLFTLVTITISSIGAFVFIIYSFFESKNNEKIIIEQIKLHEKQLANYSLVDALRNTIYGRIHDFSNPLKLIFAHTKDMEDAIDENDMDEVKYCANVIKESSSTIKTELRDLLNLLNISLNKNKISGEESREDT